MRDEIEIDAARDSRSLGGSPLLFADCFVLACIVQIDVGELKNRSTRLISSELGAGDAMKATASESTGNYTI